MSAVSLRTNMLVAQLTQGIEKRAGGAGPEDLTASADDLKKLLEELGHHGASPAVGPPESAESLAAAKALTGGGTVKKAPGTGLPLAREKGIPEQLNEQLHAKAMAAKGPQVGVPLHEQEELVAKMHGALKATAKPPVDILSEALHQRVEAPHLRPPHTELGGKPAGKSTFMRLLPWVTGAGVATGGAVAGAPLLRAASQPVAAPPSNKGISPGMLLGGVGGLAALGIGGYMLNNHLKKKRTAVERLDEDAEVES